jgi:hypothetical protein
MTHTSNRPTTPPFHSSNPPAWLPDDVMVKILNRFRALTEVELRYMIQKYHVHASFEETTSNVMRDHIPFHDSNIPEHSNTKPTLSKTSLGLFFK